MRCAASVCMCPRARVRVCRRINVCERTYVLARALVCVRACVHARGVRVCMRAPCMCVCVCVCVFVLNAGGKEGCVRACAHACVGARVSLCPPARAREEERNLPWPYCARRTPRPRLQTLPNLISPVRQRVAYAAERTQSSKVSAWAARPSGGPLRAAMGWGDSYVREVE